MRLGQWTIVLCRDNLLISTSKEQIRLLWYRRMVASLYQIFHTSTHFHKWGPKERPTLNNIGPHDFITDHQCNESALHG